MALVQDNYSMSNTIEMQSTSFITRVGIPCSLVCCIINLSQQINFQHDKDKMSNSLIVYVPNFVITEFVCYMRV